MNIFVCIVIINCYEKVMIWYFSNRFGKIKSNYNSVCFVIFIIFD